MSVSFDFTYNILPQSVQNEALNTLGKARVPEFRPSSYFFTESSVEVQTDVSGAYGPVSNSVYNITTKMALANKKAYAVTGGRVLVVPQTGSTTKVNIIIKPTKSVDIGLPIKYFVYRGLKKYMFILNNHVIADSESNTPFINKVWTDYKILNNIPEDTSPEPFEAVKFGYDENENPSTRLEKKFSVVLDENGEPANTNLPFIGRGVYFGDFADDESGFEIVLDNGTLYKPTSETGLEMDLKYARMPFFSLNIADITTATDITEKMYRENVHNFMDPAAFYGAHITKNEKGIIRVKNASSPYNTKSDIYNNIIQKFYNKNKVYLYIRAYRDKSYNYDGYLGLNSLKIGTTGALQPSPYLKDGWPILIIESQQDHSQDTDDQQKNENNLVLNLRFRSVGKQPLLYNNHGNIKNPGVQGNFLVNENLVDIENLETTEYTNEIEYGLINTYFDNYSSLLNVNNIASFIYINFEEVNPDNLSDLFMDIDSGVTFEGGFSEEILRREVSFKDRVIDQKDKVVLTRMKMIKDGSIFDATPPNLPVDNRTRLFVRKIIDSTEDTFINKLPVKPGFDAISNLDGYSNAVYGSSDYRVWKGVFEDEGTTVNSLMLTNFSIGTYITDFIQVGITENEYAALATLMETSNISFAFKSKVQVYSDLDNVDLIFIRYELGVKCMGESGDAEYYPQIPIYVYTIDEYYYFTKDYSEKFKYAEEFSKACISFEEDLFDEGYGFDWLRTRDTSVLFSYKKSILSGYEKHFELDINDEFETPGEAFQALKKEYINIPTRKEKETYYVPYLNVYPEGALNEALVPPPAYAYLNSIVNINGYVLGFEAEYNKQYFDVIIPEKELLLQGSYEFLLTIHCLEEFDTDQYIKILSY